jgi:hypothetical protein
MPREKRSTRAGLPLSRLGTMSSLRLQTCVPKAIYRSLRVTGACASPPSFGTLRETPSSLGAAEAWGTTSGFRMKYAPGRVGRKAAPPIVQGVTMSGA